ncbi:hypothetical protein CH300_20050 [Rhodococcus sp. 15-1154-1]|nr:hypothetical protein [Rhodococcus sp. 15-1154-1]OZF00835.1 hypothetical protein CH300_20050 [Rhodococcus sp. 15-1154-1]
MAEQEAPHPQPPYPTDDSDAVRQLSKDLDQLMLANGSPFSMDAVYRSLLAQAILNFRAGFVYDRKVKRWVLRP